VSESTKLVLRRRFDAATADVWDACTRPELLARWFSPKPFHVCEVEAEVRVGGRFHFRMTGEPGTFAASGVYQEVVHGERVVFSWIWVEGPDNDPPDGFTSLVTFEFAPDGEGTLMTLSHERLPDQRQIDSHQEGWTEALSKLESVLQKG